MRVARAWIQPGHPGRMHHQAYGAAVAEIVRELPSRSAILVGHSMGCRVVLEANRVQSEAVSGLVLVDGSRIGSGDPVAAEQAMADELAGDGYRRFVRDFFESMFFPSSNPALARSIVERALRFPTGLGRTLMTDLAGWDAREMESALDSVDVPVLAIQSTTLDTARRRVSLEPGLNSPWLELVSAHVPSAGSRCCTGTATSRRSNWQMRLRPSSLTVRGRPATDTFADAPDSRVDCQGRH